MNLSENNNFEIETQINKISKKYSKNKEEIVFEALKVYENYLDLLKEFDIWDSISDTDLISFEKKL